VSGFTVAVFTRSRALGRDRGAEELLEDLNRFYDGCVNEIHRFGGAVVGYAGDGVASWFDERDGSIDALGAAISAGLALQRIADPDDAFTGLKVAAAAEGDVQRLVVGDPDHQLLDILCGPLVSEVTALERHARPGELLMRASTAAALEGRAEMPTLSDERSELDMSMVTAIQGSQNHANPWPQVDVSRLTTDAMRPWLIPEVFDQVLDGQSGFLAELRDVTALFVSLYGLHLEDGGAESRLDTIVRWIQDVLARHQGTLLQLTPTERGGWCPAMDRRRRWGIVGSSIRAAAPATRLRARKSSHRSCSRRYARGGIWRTGAQHLRRDRRANQPRSPVDAGRSPW
jgi:hypothetical protein